MKSSVAVLLAVLFLVGCGGTSTTDEATDNPGEEVADADETPEPAESTGSATITKNESGVSLDSIQTIVAVLRSNGVAIDILFSQDAEADLCPTVLPKSGNAFSFVLQIGDLADGSYISLTDGNIITTFGNYPENESSEGLAALVNMAVAQEVDGEIITTASINPFSDDPFFSSQNEVTLTSANLTSGGTIEGSFAVNPIGYYTDLEPMGVIEGQFTATFKDCASE